MVSKKENPLFVREWERKSLPRDHRLSSLGKPRDANQRSSGRIFLSHPHTRDRFLYFSSFAIILIGKGKLVVSTYLSS